MNKSKMTNKDIDKVIAYCKDDNCTECSFYKVDGCFVIVRYINQLKKDLAEAQKLCRKKVGDLKTNEWIKIMKLAGYEVNAVSEKEKMEQIRKETAKEILKLLDCVSTTDVNELNHLILLKQQIIKIYSIEVGE